MFEWDQGSEYFSLSYFQPYCIPRKGWSDEVFLELSIVWVSFKICLICKTLESVKSNKKPYLDLILVAFSRYSVKIRKNWLFLKVINQSYYKLPKTERTKEFEKSTTKSTDTYCWLRWHWFQKSKYWVDAIIPESSFK